MNDTPDLSERIAADLFTDGSGRHYERLAMVSDESKRCGLMAGWSERAVADRIRMGIANDPVLREVREAARPLLQMDELEFGDESQLPPDHEKPRMQAALAALDRLMGGGP